MTTKKILGLLGVLVGFIFFGIAYIYFTHPANALPPYFPGFSATETKIHVKHGIAGMLLGISAWLFAWFQSGKPSTEGTGASKQ